MQLYLTLVLPGGCNLGCGFCAINQRKESGAEYLDNLPFFVNFVEGALRSKKISRIAIQGEEPLLPIVWQTTRSIASLAASYLVPMEMVTNGTHLAEHAGWVGGHFDTITVSIDSNQDSVENKLRPNKDFSNQTSLERARAGLSALRQNGFTGSLQIASILFPNKSKYLHSLPELIKEFQVNRWIISPYINFKRDDRPLGSMGELRAVMSESTDKLQGSGTEVVLSDEFNRLKDKEIEDGILSNQFVKDSLGGEVSLIRLSPNLNLQIDNEVYQSVEKPENFWRPEQTSAETFLDQRLTSQNLKIETQTKLSRWWGGLGRKPS